ncbi:MAG TPA: GAF domain-containing protein, partial [Bryobacteraceae bacterium]|nr:GAF domain-containing protein [Bryobacteraceae bacterium]
GETLRACADAIVQHFDVALARIWTLATGGSVLDPQASAGMYTHADGASGRVQVGSSKIGEIARSSEAHITSNLLDDLEAGDRDWARQNGVVAFAGYPLICNGRVLGVLAVFSRSALSEAHTAALQSVAEVLGQAIDRKRQEEAAISHASEIIRLARIAAEIPDGPESRPDLRSILSQIASLASRAPELAAYSAGFAVPNPSSSDGAVSS